MKTDQQSNGRRQLLVILGIAFLTLGGSYGLFYLASIQGGWGTTNHGEFVAPYTTIEDVGWRLSDPTQARNWWLWVIADTTCEAVCQQKVKDLRALHILLTKEAGRVRRGVSSLNASILEFPEAYPKLERIDLDLSRARQRLREGVYVVDPNGNFVFRYGLDVNPKDILEDLKKLLKVSQIG